MSISLTYDYLQESKIRTIDDNVKKTKGKKVLFIILKTSSWKIIFDFSLLLFFRMKDFFMYVNENGVRGFPVSYLFVCLFVFQF